MATELRGRTSYDDRKIPDAGRMKFGIVVSEWNHKITYSMRDGAFNTLVRHGALKDNIRIIHVPGSFELTLGAKLLAESGNYDAVISIGCIIQGETRHFDFICQSVTQGITQLNLSVGIPVVFCVLTTHNQKQAEERAGGKYGNKGDEAAVTAIRMVAVRTELKE